MRLATCFSLRDFVTFILHFLKIRFLLNQNYYGMKTGASSFVVNLFFTVCRGATFNCLYKLDILNVFIKFRISKFFNKLDILNTII